MRCGPLHALATAFLLHAGCTKPSANEVPDAATSVGTATGAGLVTAGPTPPPSLPKTAGPARAGEWLGTYTSQAATIYVPPSWKNVHWAGTDTSAGVGPGAMALAIDARTGRVTGTMDGPLGPAMIVGVTVGDSLTAAVVRKDPADHGFVGTMVGAFAAQRADGTMNVALWDASALRAATFTLSPDSSK